MGEMPRLGRHMRRALVRRRDREEQRLDRILWTFIAFFICAGVFGVLVLLITLLPEN